jgi:hypothetical protein
MLWAGFGERHRSRRRPADHDFLDPLRAVGLGSRRWCNSTTIRLNRPPSGPAGGRRHQPALQCRREAEERLAQWLLNYCQGATLSAVPRMAKTAQKRGWLQLGGSVSRPPGCCLDVGRQLCTARWPVKRTDSRTAPPDVAGRRRSAGEQAWSLETEQGKVRLTMIKRRLGELNKHADEEERRMGLRGRRKVVRDLISSNAGETDQDFGKLDQHMKELREIDKELRAANKIDLQPDFSRQASPETQNKASKE